VALEIVLQHGAELVPVYCNIIKQGGISVSLFF
jgi:hypothetical protein